MGTDTRHLRQAVEEDSTHEPLRLNDPPSPDDDEPVKKALRTIIGAGAPVAVARVEDRDGGGMKSTRRT